MQKMLSEPAKRRHGCFSVFVLVFYFKRATAEIKHSFISVLFQFYFNCAGAITYRMAKNRVSI